MFRVKLFMRKTLVWSHVLGRWFLVHGYQMKQGCYAKHVKNYLDHLNISKNYVGMHKYNYNRAHQLSMLDMMKYYHIKIN